MDINIENWFRPNMVEFLKELKGKYKLGCITNNIRPLEKDLEKNSNNNE